MEAIILAGGLGTRLRSVVQDVPKPLACIGNKPFLDLLLAQLASFGTIQKVILAVGYKADKIIAHYEKNPSPLPLCYSFETKPMGTGGALRKAIELSSSAQVLVLNGDSYIELPWSSFYSSHDSSQADVTIACHAVDDASRYGTVIFEPVSNRIQAFEEKNAQCRSGWINGGFYLMNREVVLSLPIEIPFSLEKEIEKNIRQKRYFSYPCSGFFIDIGTADSYATAQKELVWKMC